VAVGVRIGLFSEKTSTPAAVSVSSFNMIDPDDIPFEEGADLLNLAPRRRPPHLPDPVAQKRGRGNRQRGRRAELEAERMLSGIGARVIDQGGSGRRDKVFILDDLLYSLEVKSFQHMARLNELHRAYEQACRQALPDSTPVAMVRSTNSTHPAVWQVVTEEGVFGFREWAASVSAPA